MQLQPGLIIGQNLRLSRRLGEGGMGTVWAAEHLALGAEVAVKFLSTDLAGHPEMRARFTAEATAAARIRSPHVVQVLDHGLLEDTPYIVMELLEGQDLGMLLWRRGPLGLAEAAEIVRQCAAALSEVHARGIIHRDVKPSNIFLTRRGGELLVKLFDFGIAKQIEAEDAVKTSTGIMVGTPAYLSPEQITEPSRNEPHRDLWALSAVAYECLTGHMPFVGPSVGAIYVAIAACQYRLPSELRSDLGPAVDAWFARAFARRPEDRWRSPQELAESFSELAGGAPSGAAAILPASASAGRTVAGSPTFDGPTLPYAGGRRASVRRALWVIAALGAIAAAAVALGVGSRPPEPPPSAQDTAAAAAAAVTRTPAEAAPEPAAEAPEPAAAAPEPAAAAPLVSPAPPQALSPAGGAEAAALTKPAARKPPAGGARSTSTTSRGGRVVKKRDHGF